MKLVATMLILGASFLTTASLAADIAAKSRTYTHSCGYFSNQVSELEIVYKNTDLAWGSKVEAIFGYEGYTAQVNNRPRVPFEWSQEQTQVVHASGPSTWTFKHLAYVHDRSSPKFVEAVNIVFRLTQANGVVSYENGSGSPWGFYRIILARNGGCTSPSVPLPDFEDADIETVERH